MEQAAASHPGIVSNLLSITLAVGSEWILWLLIILSVVSVAIIIDRFIYFYKRRLDFNDFNQKIKTLLKEKNYDQIKQLCAENSTFESDVTLKGVEVIHAGPTSVSETMQAFASANKTELDRGLIILGTLGNNAPFIGLFGTVLGIIKAFNDLSTNPAGGPSVVMAGISEALVATAIGLVVAIPAVIAYNFFNRIIKRRLAQTQALQSSLLAHLNGKI